MQRQLIPIEGNTQRLDGGAMFGNAPRALWQTWSPPDPQHRIPLACRALLVLEEDRAILFETGVGAFFSPPMRERFGVVESEHLLLENLKAAGVAHEQIDVVVLSHLHFDHAGGLLSVYQEGQAAELLFPNAKIVVGHRALERARHPHLRDRASFIPELPALLEHSGRVEVSDGRESAVLGTGYRFHEVNGHTPGMLLSEIDTDQGPVVFVADLAPGRHWVHLPITMGYDRHAELVVDEKRALWEALLPRQARLFFTHDPELAIGRLTRDDKGRYRVEP
jgi:glyoxylase-like metal-dependent hydrolase (beta-lactamase superfamily II)